MNTFKGVYRALKYEVDRQIQVLEKAGRVTQETRRWDDVAGITVSMRTKEDAHDYRYFPEPDLVPVVLDSDQLSAWKSALPELPAQRRERFVQHYQLPAYDAGVLVADKEVADFYEETCKHVENKKAVSNWVMTEVLRALQENDVAMGELKVTPTALADLVRMVDKGQINSTKAKEVFSVLFEEGGDPREVVEKRGWVQVSDASALTSLVKTALDQHPKSADDYRSGKKAALQHLVGQVMRLSKGKADPKVVADLLRDRLAPS